MLALQVPDPPLADDVVALRGFTLDDVDWIVRACRDPEIPRYTRISADYTPELARGWIGVQGEEHERGEALTVAVTAAADGEPLGSASLQGIDWAQGRAEIGYWIAPWGRRRGAASSAARLLAEHA